MAKVVVTGGAGFIGSYLAHRLNDLGAETVIFDAFRNYAAPSGGDEHAREQALRSALIEGVTIEQVDLVDQQAVTESLRKYEPDVVVHLAANAILSSAEKDPDGCSADIVDSTHNLLRAIKETASVKRLVHVSSSMVYGHFGSDRVREDNRTEPVNAYGRMKLAAEELVRKQSAVNGLEVAIVRPMAVYGPGDFGRRVVTLFCARALAGMPLSVNDGADMRMDFTFVGDLAEGLALAAFEPRAAGETFNLSYGEPRSLLDVVDALKRHFPELQYELLSGDGVERPKRGGLDIAKARDLLGYKPQISLETGVAQRLAFLQGGDGLPAYGRGFGMKQ